MQAIGNLFGGGAKQPSNEPPASVLKEWESYKSSGDLEQGGSGNQIAKSVQATGTAMSSAVRDIFSSVSTGVTGASSSVAGTLASFAPPSRTQFTYFIALLSIGLFFLGLSFTVALPLIMLAPGKFAFSFSFGCAFVMSSFVVLRGWKQQMQHMFSKERLPFSAGFIGSMLATIYAALVMNSYFYCLIFSVVEMIALVYFVSSYLPGGPEGAKFFLRMIGSGLISCFRAIIGR